MRMLEGGRKGGGGEGRKIPSQRQGRAGREKVEEKVCWDSSFGGTKRRRFPYIPQCLPSANA